MSTQKTKRNDPHRGKPEVVVPDAQQVALLAYQLWHRRGGEAGRDIEDWLEAEVQLRLESTPASH